MGHLADRINNSISLYQKGLVPKVRGMGLTFEDSWTGAERSELTLHLGLDELWDVRVG